MEERGDSRPANEVKFFLEMYVYVWCLYIIVNLSRIKELLRDEKEYGWLLVRLLFEGNLCIFYKKARRWKGSVGTVWWATQIKWIKIFPWVLKRMSFGSYGCLCWLSLLCPILSIFIRLYIWFSLDGRNQFHNWVEKQYIIKSWFNYREWSFWRGQDLTFTHCLFH